MSRFRTSTFILAAALVGAAAGALAAGGAADAPEPALFVMMYTPGPAWDTAMAPNAQRHFRAHSANLARLRRDGVIVAGGRFGPWGLILLEADDLAAARAHFEPDSSLQSGTFQGDVYRWTTIYDGAIPPR